MESSPLFSQPAERIEFRYADEAAPVEHPVFSDQSASQNPPS
jgi:hypothetical protein